MLKKSEFRSAFDSVRKRIEEWNANRTDAEVWEGTRVVRIGPEIVEAFFELIDLASTMDVERSLRAPILALDEFESALHDWAEERQISPETTSPGGTPNLWNRWLEFVDSMNVRSFPAPESIESLRTQGVADRQICLIYGFVDESGAPEINKVAEELAKPGTHYNAKKWVHPSQKRIDAVISERWKERSKKVDDKAKVEPVNREAPETVEELLTQRVSSRQIAMMKGITVDEVRAIAANAGIPVDNEIPSSPVSASPEVDAERRREREARIAQELKEKTEQQQQQRGTILDQVRSLAEQGETDEAIAAKLANDHSQFTKENIAAIIKQSKVAT